MKQTTKSASGTSFHGTTIAASVNDLKKVLGTPKYSGNDGEDKTNFEWSMETDSGDVFTVYDWKEYRVLEEDEIVEWHIGGKSSRVTNRARMEIGEALESA